MQLFPITPKNDALCPIAVVCFSMYQWVRQITQNELTFDFNTDDIPKGSNTFAFNSKPLMDLFFCTLTPINL